MPKRPNLTAAELDRIAEMTEVQKLPAWKIARRIGCSLGSVTWAQLRIGADPRPDRPLPPVPTAPVACVRNGALVRRFTQADDDLLLALEAQGLNYGQIGRSFDPPRQPNSIQGRLMTLSRRAARVEAREMEAA
ncbi:hypothetical protein KOAAANKH_00129 [Brevundimonas sp. NIBR10]|uniref:hypothetical protein n=1 Tax=Brevundimonas sp. NIBR10 TaxID=3015997 RepID=UPI0022F16DC6|nr:hypothetical protein [Brevundimonas sp. NIBR10]WGM45268.1 hypothetical protein KOAAANKH_00129 [Brevundimonas sp. NIBR10]